ncbi:GNAT family N-acetyltransferase [Labrenzia sp. PHM005]|nr:GNAT family N-acetyltransferase [Labrenzia sp. PHM005]
MESLADVGLRAWQKGVGPLVPKNVYARICKDNPFLPFLKTMGETVLVADVNGKIAGFAACEDHNNHISDLWVDPEIEGRGIGSALIRKLEATIAAKGFSVSEIQVAAQNTRALGLYQHLGYQIVWQERRKDPILEIHLEKVGMKKKLSQAIEAMA